MFKRVFCVLVSFFVLASSAMAWDAESFIGMDDLDYYEFDWQPSFGVSLLSLDGDDSPSSLYSVSDYSEWNTLLSWPRMYMGVAVSGLYSLPGMYNPSLGIDIPAVNTPGTWYRPQPLVSVSAESLSSLSRWWYHFPFSFSDIEGSLGDAHYEFNTFNNLVFGQSSSPQGGFTASYVDVPLDVSSFGDFKLFSLDGSFDLTAPLRKDGTWLPMANVSQCALFVNGSSVSTFISDSVGHITFDNFIFDSTDYIRDITFRFNLLPGSTPVLTGSHSYEAAFVLDHWNVTFDVLKGNDFLPSVSDQAQNDIQNHESLESEWTGSMSQNFNQLNIQGFNFPNGLISGFALISGIFNDIWNSMGDYRVVYVFPLMLGIVLLLIGRIGKSQALFNRKEGDDS